MAKRCDRCGGFYNRGISTIRGTRYRCSKCGHVSYVEKIKKQVKQKKVDNRGKKIGVLGKRSIFAISDPKGLY